MSASCAPSGPKTPQNVPFDDITKLWGTWYVIGAEFACTDSSSTANVCTQLNFQPEDNTSTATNLDYLASYNSDNQPYGPSIRAQGAFYPVSANFSASEAPYLLEVPVGSGVMSNFWFLATDGDASGNHITSLVTLSCPGTGTDSQMFFLSRKPYFVAPTTFYSMATLAAQAVTNFGDHNFTLVKQAKGWCNYPFDEVAI